jgi:hypothetical protein
MVEEKVSKGMTWMHDGKGRAGQGRSDVDMDVELTRREYNSFYERLDSQSQRKAYR